MNTKMNKLVLAIGAMTMAGGAMAATANGTASATIINPIAVSETRSLKFGSITTLGAAGAVVLAATEGSSKTDTTVTSTGGESGIFTVVGGETNGYTIIIPGTVSLASTSGYDDATMTVSLVPSKTAGILAGGADSFFVGGRLDISAKQNAGTYSGTYTVTVNYQ